MTILKNIFWKHRDYAALFLRIAIGVVFMYHGYDKLFVTTPANFAGFLAGFGVPATLTVAWAVAIVEFVGGLLILIGLFTRYVALLLAIEMIFAFFLIHMRNGFLVSNNGFEFVLVLFLSCVALLFSGSRSISVEKNLLDRDL